MDILRKNKKILLIGLSVVLVLLIVLVFQRYIPNFKQYDGPDNYDMAIEVLNEKIPTEIFVYGEEITVRDTVQYKTVNELSEESLETKKNNSVLIVNDWNGNVKLSEEDIAFIKEKTNSDLHFYFYYLGKDKLEMMEREGLFSKNAFDENDYCVGISTYYGDRIEWGGIFTETDYEVAEKHNIVGRPEEFIIEHVAMCYDTNN